MTREEDLVRSTIWAIASTVHDVAPLRLEPAPDELRHSPRPTRPARAAGNRRMRRWDVPFAAAVAVVSVAASLVIVKHIANGPVAHGATAASSASREVPEYYASLTPPSPGDSHLPQGLLVGDTFTGKTVATVPPPAGESFTKFLAAAADDRTWVAYAIPAVGPGHHASAASWYQLRLTPGTAHPVLLTSLPVKPLAGVVSIALSGSGRELAVARFPGSGKQTLEVYSVATGRLLRDWTTVSSSVFLFGFTPPLLAPALTWIDSDRAIAFPAHFVKSPTANSTLEAIRSVDIAAPSGALITASRVIWSATATRTSGPLSGNGYLMVSADGKTIVCITWAAAGGSSRSKTRLWRLDWVTLPISAQPGRNFRGAPVPVDYQTTVTTTGLSPLPPSAPTALSLWVNATGSTLLGEWSIPSYPPRGIRFGVIGHGTFTPLPVPAALFAVDSTPIW